MPMGLIFVAPRHPFPALSACEPEFIQHPMLWRIHALQVLDDTTRHDLCGAYPKMVGLRRFSWESKVPPKATPQ